MSSAPLSSPPSTDAQVRAYLASQVYPGSGRDLASFVSQFLLDGTALRFFLDGEAPLNGVAADDTVRAWATERLSEISAQLQVPLRVEVNWLDALVGRGADPADPLKDVKHVILVMSGKGGVGKSTVCTNLALGLKRLGYRVGLLDADMYGPSLPTMMGITGRPQSDGSRIEPLVRFGVPLMSIGFLLEDAKSAVVWRGPMLHAALLQFVKDVNWGKLDFLLLDLPPGTGDISLTIAQNVKTTGAVVVTTPQDVALADVYKSLSMNQKVGIATLGIVENESYFVCDGCNKQHRPFGEGGGRALARDTGAPLLAELPLDPAIRQWGDAGTPVVQASPGSDIAKAFLALAAEVVQRAEALTASRNTLNVDRSGGQNRHLPVAR